MTHFMPSRTRKRRGALRVRWAAGLLGGVALALAYLEVQKTTQYNGHPVFRLMARAESNAVVSRIYKVRNRIESMWDRNGLFSWRYAEDRREGKYRAKNEILFDQGRGEARYHTAAAHP